MVKATLCTNCGDIVIIGEEVRLHTKFDDEDHEFCSDKCALKFKRDYDDLSFLEESKELLEESKESKEFLYSLHSKVDEYKDFFNVKFIEIIEKDNINDFNGLHLILGTGKEFVLKIEE